MMRTLIYEALSKEIIGAAITVLNALNPGLDGANVGVEVRECGRENDS